MLGKQSGDDAAFALSGLAGDSDIAASGQQFGNALANCGKLGGAADETIDTVIDEAGVIGEAGAQACSALFVNIGSIGISVIGEVVNDNLVGAQPGFELGDIGSRFFELGNDGEWGICAMDDLLAAEMLNTLALELQSREVVADCVVVWHGISSVGLPSTPLATGVVEC